MTHKLLDPKIIKVSDEILDINKVASKYKAKIKQSNLEFHSCRIEIENWPVQLTNLFRNFLFKNVKVKRLVKITVESDDQTIITNHVQNRLSFIKLSRDAPLGVVELNIKHDLKIPNPIIISTHDLKYQSSKIFSKYVDEMPIAYLTKNKKIKISAVIEEDTSADINFSSHDLLLNFDRTEMTEIDEQGNDVNLLSCVEFEHNGGAIKFTYQDNVNIDTLLTEFVNWGVEYLQRILTDESYIVPVVSTVTIRLPNDPARIIANTILVYVYEALNREYMLKDTMDGVLSIISIVNIEHKKAYGGIEKGINKLIKHLNLLRKG